MTRRILLRLARAIVMEVIGQLIQQIEIVRDQAENPFRTMLQQVTGGIWRGRGANAFAEEVNSVLLPQVARIIESVVFINGRIQHACDVIDEADQDVNRMANGLGDLFEGIY
jgi:hypothetical protein